MSLNVLVWLDLPHPIENPEKKPAEASMDWKPNACIALRHGIEPGLSGTQRWGRTAMPSV